MKTIKTLFLALTVLLLITSCSENKKETTPKETETPIIKKDDPIKEPVVDVDTAQTKENNKSIEKVTKKQTKKVVKKKITPKKPLLLNKKRVSINWTAYKTTSKVPVKGIFTDYDLKVNKGSAPKEVLNNASLIIRVNSIMTGNKERDEILKNTFFGTMASTSELKGVLKMTSDSTGTVALTMNGVTHNMPVKVKSDASKLTITGVVNLDNWATQAAIKALNMACKDKHKGADGISKTWSEVNVLITVAYAK